MIVFISVDLDQQLWTYIFCSTKQNIKFAQETMFVYVKSELI